MDNPNVIQTLKEMLHDRGYSTPDDEDISEFFVVDNAILVVFLQEAKLGINSVKSIETILKEEGIYTAIVIYKNSITSFAKSSIQTLETEGFTINLFEVAELVFNVTKHHLVPKHILQTKEQKRQLLKQMMCTEKKLPYIFSSDPLAKYYGAKPGDLFFIERRNECGYINPYYRLVV